MFTFPNPREFKEIAISLEDVKIAYDGKPPNNSRHNFWIYLDSRIGLVVLNVTGKSTLMKLIDGVLPEASGYIDLNHQLRFCHFHQHHIDKLPTQKNSVEYLQSVLPTAQDGEICQFLGKFGLKSSTPLQKIETLSGGQKKRPVFAEICWKKPHLLLDEPRNHLDSGSIESPLDVLTNFGGVVVLISHHQHLIEAVCNSIWVVDGNQSGEREDSVFSDYK